MLSHVAAACRMIVCYHVSTARSLSVGEIVQALALASHGGRAVSSRASSIWQVFNRLKPCLTVHC